VYPWVLALAAQSPPHWVQFMLRDGGITHSPFDTPVLPDMTCRCPHAQHHSGHPLHSLWRDHALCKGQAHLPGLQVCVWFMLVFGKELGYGGKRGKAGQDASLQ
jgi:hypothetical protein